MVRCIELQPGPDGPYIDSVIHTSKPAFGDTRDLNGLWLAGYTLKSGKTHLKVYFRRLSHPLTALKTQGWKFENGKLRNDPVYGRTLVKDSA